MLRDRVAGVLSLEGCWGLWLQSQDRASNVLVGGAGGVT